MVEHRDEWRHISEVTGWVPKGIIKFADFIWGGPPPSLITKVVYWASLVSIFAMMVGLLTLPSQILATIGTTYLVSLQTSYGPYWSHAYNVQLLAALVFMFCRHSGDVLSIDAIIRKLRGRPPARHDGHYWWPVIFAELATTMFMASAFFQKFRVTGIWWAWSDNIRNALGISWFQYRSDPPDLVVFIASHPWAWHTAGTLQLFTQSTTILAAFLVARPVFRAIFGAVFFFIEILALTHVFEFWHPFWVPLCALSIDWEHFVRQARQGEIRYPAWARRGGLLRPLGFLFQHRLEKDGAVSVIPNMEQGAMAAVLAFGMIFFGYYAANIYFRLGEKHLNYPFSSMAFFSETRAHEPYDEHHYWPAFTGRIDAYEAGSNSPVDLWSREGALEDKLFRVNTIGELEAIDAAFRSRAQKGLVLNSADPKVPYVARTVTPVRIAYRAGQMAVPPYPAKLMMVDYQMALRAVRDQQGFRALVASVERDKVRKQFFVRLTHKGFQHPRFEMMLGRGHNGGRDIPQISPLMGEWDGDRFYFTEKFQIRYLLVHVVDPALGIDENYYVGFH